MVVIRKRLIFWLVKAYIKKNGKIITFSFLLGLIIFFGLLYASQHLTRILPIFKRETIGVTGAYTEDNLPPFILQKISHGLTYVDKDGSVKPDLATSWKSESNGKKYTFYLKKNSYFSDGRKVTVEMLNYNFSDVSINKPDAYTIVFTLKDAYAPFLTTVSKPVFAKGYIGAGDYKIDSIKLNGDYVQSLTISSVKNRFDTITYLFYPTEDALEMAYLLGEITQASNLTTPKHNTISFQDFKKSEMRKKTDYSKLVTLFYNTTDGTLSDRKVRIALSYALPDTFSYGEKAYESYDQQSIYFNKDITQKKEDLDHAKLLLSESESSNASGSASTVPKTLYIKVMRKYRPAAIEIAKVWDSLGMHTTVEEVDQIPSSFQIFLGDFTVPKDPDQYTLWHSEQQNNITKYKNLRIDKLLEDGRKTPNEDERQQIYSDFQKYLSEDVPASFLYFPYVYDIVRK